MSQTTRRDVCQAAVGIAVSAAALHASSEDNTVTLTGMYHVLATPSLSASRAFYEEHFGMKPAFIAEWYVQLVHPTAPTLQLGLIVAGHPSMPSSAQRPNAATIVTLQVKDVDAVFDDLHAAGVELVSNLCDEPWGQRHFIAIDPAGFFVDIVMPIEPSAEYARAYVAPPE
jgi:uncharacterized glyoxalase superfamily protein PhnB